MLVGPFALPAVWLGMWRSFASAWPVERLKSHAARVDLLMAGLPLAILCGHSLLHWLGKFSSSGALRYLLIVAPLSGCLAARGWEWVFLRTRWPRPISWAALAVVMPGLVNYCWRVLPVKQTESWDKAEQIVQWYEHNPLRQKYPRIMSNHPGIFFYLNASPWDRAKVEPWSPDAIDHPPAGVLLIWDPEFCTRNSDPRLVAPLSRLTAAGWTDDTHADWACGLNGDKFSPHPPTGDWHMLEKTGPG
jgi:hypothetical protein